MESDGETVKSNRIKSNVTGPLPRRSKLYDPRKGSAYSKLSKTHENKLRQCQEYGHGTLDATTLTGRVKLREPPRFLKDGSASYGDVSDAWLCDSSMEFKLSGTRTGTKKIQQSGHGGRYSRSIVGRNNASQKALSPTSSLPPKLDTTKVKELPSDDRSSPPPSQRDTRPFESLIQVPYLENLNESLMAAQKSSWLETVVAPAKNDTEPILIESFRNSTLPSFRASTQLSQSFSMLTFNAGLLEVRMLGLQMYQNPGYTEKRLRCVPSEIRKADADVVAFQEVYSNNHAQYIMQELKDLYPYAARDDCLPVSKDFADLYVKSKKNRKRGIGMFHSGLLFLSKFPILCAKFHAWDVVTHLEALLANKGYMEIFVDIPAVGKIAFYNMHMASASVNPESSHIENVRNEEVKQLLKTTERACRLGFAPIIIGDLNAAPNNCASNYMSFIHSGWTDSYVLSRQKVKQKKPLGMREKRMTKGGSETMSSPSLNDSIGVENVFGDDRCQRPQLDKVTVLSNLPRSKSGGNIRLSQWSVQEGSRWSRFMEYFAPSKHDRMRRSDATWQNVRAYYPRGSSMSLRVLRCHTLENVRTPKSKKMAKLQKRLVKHRLRVSVRAPCLEGRKNTNAKTFREKCYALFRRSRSLWVTEPKPAGQPPSLLSSRSRVEIRTSEVYFHIKNPAMQLKVPRVKRFYWWYRRRNFMDVTWDPRNPLNMHGPHAGCSGLRCDYIFLPPQNIAGILQGFTPSSGEILFRDPIVVIDKMGSAYNCLCSTFTSMKKVMLVTLSDHYGLKITMARKNVVRRVPADSIPRNCRTI
ncbi:uncharacterized protein BXIN_0034 [Babesia sp. Xinjiang]|uniref:uncharacterized protein n=1 Tax=Babesia sp. Xinjiang TaxID=462227 RepID=UPI000A232E26|nr:uncharacterized protein BXIN_0034 [Babesia sp. Xinjiang]ORM39772.1 hypothetical protein BXIN_0034 [Babesia sp. Xinjiang]